MDFKYASITVTAMDVIEQMNRLPLFGVNLIGTAPLQHF